MSKLSVKYRENLECAVKGVDLEIKPKEKIGVVGRTGSGKSTLLNALLRILEPFEGTIEVDDENLQDVFIRAIRRKFSIIA